MWSQEIVCGLSGAGQVLRAYEEKYGRDHKGPCMSCEGAWSMRDQGKILAGDWTAADLHFRKISLATIL